MNKDVLDKKQKMLLTLYGACEHENFNVLQEVIEQIIKDLYNDK